MALTVPRYGKPSQQSLRASVATPKRNLLMTAQLLYVVKALVQPFRKDNLIGISDGALASAETEKSHAGLVGYVDG